MTLLDIHAVHKTYGQHKVLTDIHLTVAAGSRTAIVGPSGSGKTTLLRIIAGFEVPDAGQITLGDRPLADGLQAVPAHLRGIGFVPQDGALFPHLTVEGNVGFGLPKNTPNRRQRLAELMDMVALDVALLKRRPHEISGGQQQRVALARALAQSPSLMLLDEPFSALDTGLRAATRKAIAKLLSDAGITTILVTHDQAEALSFADQVAVLHAGRLVQVGRPTDLYLHPRDAETASFLGDAIVLPAQLGGGWADCALGRLAVNDNQRSGPVQIMLRPEQIMVTEVPAAQASEADQAGICLGVVSDTDFGGSVCAVSVRLLRGDGAAVPGHHPQASEPAPLLIRSSALQVLSVGATVRLSVTGQAHVFAAAA